MERTSDHRVHFYSDSALGILALIYLVFAIVGFLLIPGLLLFLYPMDRVKMAMTTSGFVVAFAVFLSSLHDIGEYEVFIGTATYVAKPVVMNY